MQHLPQNQAHSKLVEQQKMPTARTATSGFDLLGDLGSDPFGSTDSGKGGIIFSYQAFKIIYSVVQI